MRVLGYPRVSTDEQARSGLGLVAQRASIEAEAARRGWTVDYATDDGISGSVPPADRPALGATLDRLDRGDVLIAAKLDRIGRSALDVLALAARADEEGWDLVVLDLGLDTSTPVGRFVLTMLAGVAELERGLIAARTRDALAAAKARGTRLGRPVETPETIRLTIAHLRREGWSLRAIADHLTAEGVPTARGGARWYPASVSGVLRSLALDAEAETAREVA
ncbi:recombinase family protein [Egicoccus halophilus]|uniref:Resolvase n=1 Tax=Egicoccus halophilus TaxID=1670830 RepID=A0A8J3ABB7_9ACTN|nr:recombinase family protein [Egicoccus halophilus]GGI09781.1 resolvase [Egicoccus halophilus]